MRNDALFSHRVRSFGIETAAGRPLSEVLPQVLMQLLRSHGNGLTQTWPRRSLSSSTASSATRTTACVGAWASMAIGFWGDLCVFRGRSKYQIRSNLLPNSTPRVQLLPQLRMASMPPDLLTLFMPQLHGSVTSWHLVDKIR